MAMASWNGTPLQNVMNWWALRKARVMSGGAQVNPTFHPVNEKVFPVEEIMTVRSRMPGREESGTCSASNTRCS